MVFYEFAHSDVMKKLIYTISKLPKQIFLIPFVESNFQKLLPTPMANVREFIWPSLRS